MKKIIALLWIFSIFTIAEEGIVPTQFKVELAKKCEIMMLHEKPNKTSKKIFTSASTGGCVQNMGCIRDITQKELDSVDKKKRYFMAWKNPIWCKVAVGKKKGWILKQFLLNEPCEEF